jgi:UDP-N-acetylmuramoyl-L-alanyl-D-glutamate--2,6-diaminopimelate ligase
MSLNPNKIEHKLADLLLGLPFETKQDLATLKISGIKVDSRLVVPGDLFFAIQGSLQDGSVYIQDAITRGAVAIVADLSATESVGTRSVPVIFVPQNLRSFYSILCARFFLNPSTSQKIVAVTGTNGKSTTHFMVSELLSKLSLANLRIGTLGIFCENLIDQESLTTPDAFDLQRSLALALQSNIRHVAMEVSSHALSQARVDQVDFDVAIFTNLTRDHLDYHGDFEHYFAAKKLLFERLVQSKKEHKRAIVCVDSAEGEILAAELREKKQLDLVTYGFSAQADWQIQNFIQDVHGCSFELKIASNKSVVAIRSSYIADYNALNLTAALLAVEVLGFSLEQLAPLCSKLNQAPGRLESVGQKGIGVYVDYAHTPDALEKALKSLKPLSLKSGGRLVVLFGCGGDRDAGKRPLMGAVADSFADLVIVTSDNPRTENPNKIIADILASGISPEACEVDRAKAINLGLKLCRPGDVFLIAGKGHENYQIIGKDKIHFSDQEQVQTFFKLDESQQ